MQADLDDFEPLLQQIYGTFRAIDHFLLFLLFFHSYIHQFVLGHFLFVVAAFLDILQLSSLFYILLPI